MRNRLAESSSPYLRQHAANPVHWQEWDEAALKQAKATDTPILLSIGYSACHWCHVMAHESFEDDNIAAVMNDSFVNIKLDREQRPDLDRVYQLAHQALSGRGGGWPLTVFLDPQNLTPFFAGTYFPPTPRHGLPAFPDVLQKVRAYFDTHRDELRDQGAQLREWIARSGQSTAGDAPDLAVIDSAVQRIAARFDSENGGNRGAPKFPHAAELELLLDCAQSSGDLHATMTRTTLAKMAARGLQDHLGGGFFRYCVDEAWTIPHFEKMLYDNAELLTLYARAAQRFRDRVCAQAAHGIADWLKREMTASDGAFFSALDADSEGEEGLLVEGKFYVWTREQIRAALTPAEFATIEYGYGLEQPPNFEGRAWHLVKARTLEQIAQILDQPVEEVQHLLAAARQKLFEARSLRIRPATDDKMLTAWNALTISGLAHAARALNEPGLLQTAERALDTLRDQAWLDGKLYANIAEARSRIPSFLDDHAFLLDALVEMLQQRWRDGDLAFAIALADALLATFEDKAQGGFFFSAEEHATPLQRSKTFTDDALPNGNGVAACGLLRLGHLLGETRYLDAAHRALRAASATLREWPDACPAMLRALREFHVPRTQVVVRCTADEEAAWREALDNALQANDIDRERIDAFFITSSSRSLPGLLAQRKPRKGGIAYVCEGLSCRVPIHSPRGLAKLFDV